MNYDNFLPEAIVGFASGFTAWFFARRKNKAQAAAAEIENVDKVITVWRETAEKLHKELTVMREEQKEVLKEQKESLKEKNTLLQEAITSHKSLQESLKRQAEELESENKQLKAQIKSEKQK